MLKSWLTFGLSADQEDRFRQTHLGADIAQARICILLVIVPLVGFAVNDYGFFGLSRTFYAFAGLRLVLLAQTILLLKSLRGLTSYRSYDRAEFVWALCVAVFAVGVSATRPQAFVSHTTVAVVGAFLTVLAIPNRFVNQLIVFFAYALGETLVLLPGLWSSRLVSVTALLSLWLANSIAVACAWQLHCWRRREFLARAEERRARTEAEQQLAERQQAEEALRQSEEEFRAFFNTVTVATAELGLDARFLRTNERLTRITGYSHEELLRMTPAELTHPEDRQREDPALSAYLAGHSPTYHAEKRYIRKDGDIVWVEVAAAMVRDPAGKPLRSVGVIQDITARKRAEEALRESEQKFAKAFAQNAAGMFITRLQDGRYLEVNNTWLQMFGFRREEVLGRTALELNMWGATEERDRALDDLRGKGSFHNAEFRMRRRSGEMFVALASAEVVTMAGEKVILGNCLDITERTRAEEALRESEQRFRHLSEHSPDSIALHDVQLRHLYVNPAIARIVGRPQGAFVGRSVGEMGMPPEAARQIERMLRQTLERETEHQDELVFPTPDGPRYFLWRSVPLRGADGKTGAILAISTDITERKRAEEALRLAKEELAQTNANLEVLVQRRTAQLERANQLLKEENEQRRRIESDLSASEQQFRTLADSIPNLAWWANGDGYITWYNHRWYEYTGTTPEQMEGWGWQTVHDPLVLPTVLERWRASIATGEPFDMEFPLRGGDGRFRLFLTRIHPLKDAEGRVVRWFGTNTDVEKLKQAEAALRESEQRLKLAHQAAHIGAFEWNVQTGVNIWTPELEAMYGLKPGEFGRTQPAWEQLVHPEDRAGAVRTVERAFQTFQPEEGEWRVVWPDGSVHWVIGRFQVFKDHAGKPLRLTGVNLDITERKLLEREILSAVDQERQRLGRDLHDGLCQILTATKFKLGLLQRKLARKSPVEPAEALMLEQEVNRAIEQAQAMAQGLNPVRLVAQGLTCALGELARSIQVSFQVRCTCDSGERVTIADQATAQHLYRIAQEAVRNALNHGKARNIRIELKELGERISLAVRDDGVGFSPASEQGAGMGLHNMKARAQMIRGSLDIESGQPGGTVVTCTLPRVRDESASS